MASEFSALLIIIPEPGYPLYIRAGPYLRSNRRACTPYVSSFARSMPHNPTGHAPYVGWIEVQEATAQKYGVHRRTSSVIQLIWRLKVPIGTRHSVQHRARRYRLISKLEFQRSGLTLYTVYDSCVVQFPGTANLRGAKQRKTNYSMHWGPPKVALYYSLSTLLCIMLCWQGIGSLRSNKGCTICTRMLRLTVTICCYHNSPNWPVPAIVACAVMIGASVPSDVSAIAGVLIGDN